MEDRPGVFACLRCKSRKIKCDREIPKCMNCARSGNPCLVNDPSTGRHVPRSYIIHLESRIKQLEYELETARQVTSMSIPAYNWMPESELPYHGSSSGFSVALRLAQELKKNGADVQFGNFSHLVSTGKPFMNDLKGPWCLPTNLVSKREAESLVKWYFEQCNATFPVFHREQFIELYFEPVYGYISPNLDLCSEHTELHLHRSSLEPGAGTFYRKWVDCANSMVAAPEPHIQNCLYFLYMVFALGTITNNRLASENPQQGPIFLAAAMNYYSAVAGGRTKDDQLRCLQAILLLSVYGVMMPMSSSAWYTIGNAMRLCIHMGLHNEDNNSTGEEDPYLVDMQRRLFWTAYTLDRVISLNLGRPVSISDEFINCKLPSLADDSYLKPAMQNEKVNSTFVNPPDRPSYKWVFFSMLLLRQIQHKIQFALYDKKEREDVDTIKQERNKFIEELEEWHKKIPWSTETFNFRWNVNMFELNYNYTRILLYRSSSQIPNPTTEDYENLIDACMKVLNIYVEFVQTYYLVYTWTAVHNILQASASCLYALYKTDALNQKFDLDELELLMSNVELVMNQLEKVCEAAKSSKIAWGNMTKITIQWLRRSKRQKMSNNSNTESLGTPNGSGCFFTRPDHENKSFDTSTAQADAENRSSQNGEQLDISNMLLNHI